MILENLLFIGLSTAFFFLTGWYWRNAKPYSIPTPLKSWVKYWFLTVQILGVIVPLIALIWWGFWLGNTRVIEIFASYFLILGLQIAAESLSLKKFQSVVWVMIPYLYVPYRVWQLYQGLNWLEPNPELMWVKIILWVNIVVWIGNYCLNLVQLPLLLRWETNDSDSEQE